MLYLAPIPFITNICGRGKRPRHDVNPQLQFQFIYVTSKVSLTRVVDLTVTKTKTGLFEFGNVLPVGREQLSASNPLRIKISLWI